MASVRVLPLRRLGVRLPDPPDDRAWRPGWLHMGGQRSRREYHRCLELRGPTDPPVAPPLLVLHEPILADAGGRWVTLRGVERIERRSGEVIACVQEWLVDFSEPSNPAALLGELAPVVGSTALPTPADHLGP